MPVLKTKFLKSGFKQPNAGGSGRVSSTIANSELDILEMKLTVNGFLSKAALDQLTTRAEELKSQYNTGTQTGRNAVASMNTRIASYNEDVKKLAQQKSEMAHSQEDIENDLSILQSDYSSDPKKYFSKQEARLNEALESINFQYEGAKGVGDVKSMNDYFTYYQQIKGQRDYLRTMGKEIEGEGKANVGVFIITDPQGNPVSVEYKPTAYNDGFIETNKAVDGINIWLKPSSSSGGVKRAFLGGQQFITEKAMGQTPQEILSSTSGVTKLVSASAEDITSDHLQIRSFIPENGWAVGKTGTVYKHLGKNQYQAYGGVKPEDMGLQEGDYQKINTIWEDRINQSVVTGMSVDPASLRNGVKEEPSNVFSGNDLSTLQSTEPEKEAQFGQPRFDTGGQTTPEAVKEEEGGFVGTVKNIWKGMFRGKKKQQQEEVSPAAELPSFVDKL